MAEVVQGAESPSSVQATVSVVIPLYNKAKYAERSLKSVLAQTYAPLEILVVDDGSTDDGPAVVRELAQAHATISVITIPNGGPGAARNAGLAVAAGDYVAFLDADDEWFPEFLHKGMSFLHAADANITVMWTGYVRSPNEGTTVGSTRRLAGVHEFQPDTEIALVNEIASFVCACTAIVRTEVALKWGGFYDRNRCLLGEDQYFFLRLLFNERFGIIEEPLVVYHVDASDLTNTQNTNIFSLEPYLEDPETEMSECPPQLRELLAKHLSFLALIKAASFAKTGRRKQAINLLSRFSGYHSWYSPGVLYVQILATISPTLPFVRQLRRSAINRFRAIRQRY